MNKNKPAKMSNSNNVKRALQIFIFILIIDLSLYFVLNFIFISIDPTPYISFLEIFDPIFIVLEIVATICIMWVIILGLEWYAIKSTQNLKIVEFIVAFICLVITGFQAGIYLMDPELKNIFITIFLSIYEWVFKNLIIFSAWIVILVIIGIRANLRTRGLKYKLFDYKLKNNQFLVFYDNRGNKKVFAILELATIPTTMRVREKRFRAQKVEKLMVGENKVYIHQHLTVLMTHLKNINLSYEISLNRDKIHIRLIISMEGKNEELLLKEMAIKVDIVERIFKYTFPGIEFNHLGGIVLRESFEDIILKFSNRTMKFLDENILEIKQNIGHVYLKIYKISGVPNLKADGEKTQIDELISLLINNRINSFSYYTGILPDEILEFNTNQSTSYEFFEREDTISDEALKNKILETRHKEVTGLYKFSTFLVVRATNLKTLKRDCEKIKAIFASIFVDDQDIVSIKKQKIPFVLPYIISRNIYKEPQKITSERLAAYIHLPELPFQINCDSPPIFELPSEELFNEKIGLGDLLGGKETLYPLGIDIIDLSSNILISGAENSLKSMFLSKLLIDVHNYYPDINITIFDMNSEYSWLRKQVNDINYIDLSLKDLYEVNIFEPTNSMEEHARNLYSIIKDCYHELKWVSNKSENVIKNIIKKISTNPFKIDARLFMDEVKKLHQEIFDPKEIDEFYQILMKIYKFNSNKKERKVVGKKIEIQQESISDKFTLFDFGSLNLQDKMAVKVLFNLLISRFLNYYLKCGTTNELKNLIVINNADILVPSTFREIPESDIGEDIPLLVKRVGTSIICISDELNISRDFINNAELKVLFKNNISKKEIFNIFNINRDQENFIREMPLDVAIIQSPGFSYPFPIKLPDYNFPKELKHKPHEINESEENINIKKEVIQKFEKSIPEIIKSNHIDESNDLHFKNFKPLDLKDIEDLMKNDEFRNAGDGFKIKLGDYKSYGKKEINLNDLSSKTKLVYDKIKELIETTPQSIDVLKEKLDLSGEELYKVVKELTNAKIIFITQFPQYNENSLIEKISIEDPIMFLKKMIEEKCNSLLLKVGGFVKLSNNILDYISKSGKIAVKIYAKPFNTILKEDFKKEIIDIYMQQNEYSLNKLILITSFIKHKNLIRKWLEEWKFIPTDCYSFQKSDFSEIISKYLLKT